MKAPFLEKSYADEVGMIYEDDYEKVSAWQKQARKKLTGKSCKLFVGGADEDETKQKQSSELFLPLRVPSKEYEPKAKYDLSMMKGHAYFIG